MRSYAPLANVTSTDSAVKLLPFTMQIDALAPGAILRLPLKVSPCVQEDVGSTFSAPPFVEIFVTAAVEPLVTVRTRTVPPEPSLFVASARVAVTLGCELAIADGATATTTPQPRVSASATPRRLRSRAMRATIEFDFLIVPLSRPRFQRRSMTDGCALRRARERGTTPPPASWHRRAASSPSYPATRTGGGLPATLGSRGLAPFRASNGRASCAR